jgi:hypothetical protein
MNFRALKRISSTAGSAAVLCLALTASAQQKSQGPEDVTPPPPSSGAATDEQPPTEALPPCPAPEQAPPPAPPPPAPAPVAHHNRIFAPGEISASTGAGPSNYFGTALNATTDTGAAWNARLTFGTHSIIALEAGYIGASNNIDMVNGTTNHGRLASHGVDGDLRLQLPLVVEPYIFGGVGYNHMETVQNGQTSFAGPLNQTDDQVTVPAGAGLSGYVGKHMQLDARGTYRFIPDNGLTVMSNRNLHQWMAQANIGYVF